VSFMIYELQAPSYLPPFPDIFAGLPPRIVGVVVWILFTVLCVVYAFAAKGLSSRRFLGIPIPVLLASAVYTGLFINTYDLVDEVSINLKHSYNLYHYAKFSMSPERWIDGTVEFIYYLLHAPFAWSRHSLIVSNYAISYLVGLLHFPLVYQTLDPESGPGKRTLQLCGFALCLPLVQMFSSGFGNGLVSLLFLAAIASALNGREFRSLVLSGLLPLLRPDAVFLSAVNAVVVAVSRRVNGRPPVSLREHSLPLLLPAVSVGVYYSFYRAAFGHWVPTPVYFKAFRWPMIAMTNKAAVLRDIAQYFSSSAHPLALMCGILVLSGFFMRGRRPSRGAGDQRVLTLLLYALATLPLLLFYSFTHETIGDFSFQTYPRYWIGFEMTLQLSLLAVLGNVHLSWQSRSGVGGSTFRAMNELVVLLAFLCLSVSFVLGNSDPSLSFFSKPGTAFFHKPGRADGVFAGAFTQRYLPPEFTVSTSEMDTFGLMIERPVIDLWGYSNPEIAFSAVCNGNRIRSNDKYFLAVKPDVYWPYWFTSGMDENSMTPPDFDSVEKSLATVHHTSKTGNLLGDMSQVFLEYDVVLIKAKQNQLVYLVRKEALGTLVTSLLNRGFAVSRQRPVDIAAFRRLYDAQTRVSYRCR